MKVELNPYQDIFLFSQKRFPAMVSAVGTGKSMMLLLKIWNYCEAHPNSLALIVRREYTDLRDSTIKDFQSYFGVTIDANKEYRFPKRRDGNPSSVIMFRHGGEMAVLKNMNLSIAGIEQAEEFETDEVFTFIRDRLRRQNGPYRQLCVIANACGHNWIWRLWISRAEVTKVMDQATGQIHRMTGTEHESIEANTFANEHNLPKDFVEDLRRMREDAPNHYVQYVLNSHEEVDADDLLFKHRDVYAAPDVLIPHETRTIKRCMGVDVARYGNDKSVFSVIEQKDLYRWEQIYVEQYHRKDTVWLAGQLMDLERRFDIDIVAVDDVGVGGGVTDLCKHHRVAPFTANATASAKYAREYQDSKTEAYFMLSDLISQGWIKLLADPEQAEQLMTIRFCYANDGRKRIVGKEEMRRKYKDLKSPDMAEALAMAVWATDKRPQDTEDERINRPSYARTDYDIDDMGRQPDNLPAYGYTQ